MLVAGDDHDPYPGTGPAPALQGCRHRNGPLAQPDHFTESRPADHDHGRGPGEQIVVRPVHADPAAVSDHVSLRQRREHRANRAPQTLQPGTMLSAGHPGQHIQAAAQFLHVLPHLMRLQAAAGGHRQAEQPAAGVEPLAIAARQAVDEVTAGRITLGEQHWPRPDRGQRD